MKKVYDFISDLENFANFYELYDNVSNQFLNNHRHWKKIKKQSI